MYFCAQKSNLIGRDMIVSTRTLNELGVSGCNMQFGWTRNEMEGKEGDPPVS